MCVLEGRKEGEDASPLSAVSFLAYANPGVQGVAEYFAKFGKAAAPPDRGFEDSLLARSFNNEVMSIVARWEVGIGIEGRK